VTSKHDYQHDNVIFQLALIVLSTISELATQNQEICFLGHQAQPPPIGAILHLINKSSF